MHENTFQVFPQTHQNVQAYVFFRAFWIIRDREDLPAHVRIFLSSVRHAAACKRIFL